MRKIDKNAKAFNIEETGRYRQSKGGAWMLNGKVAVVTGASRGIGRQIAISMAKEGAVVIVNYNGSAAKAEDVVKEITEAGGQAEAVQCNVSDYSAAEVFLKDIISRYKRIDILVNNAGITRDNLLMKMSEGRV